MADPDPTTPPPCSVEEWPGYVTHCSRGQRNLVLIDRAKSKEKTGGRYRWLVRDTEAESAHAFPSRKKAEAALEMLLECVVVREGEMENDLSEASKQPSGRPGTSVPTIFAADDADLSEAKRMPQRGKRSGQTSVPTGFAQDSEAENVSAGLQKALESSFDFTEIIEWLRSLCTAEKMVSKSGGKYGSTDYLPVPDTGPRERGLRLLLSYLVGRELPRDDTGGATVRTVEEIEERLKNDEVYREAMVEVVGGLRPGNQ